VVWGRWTYAVGRDPKAALETGIRVKGVPGVPSLDDRVDGMIEGVGGLDDTIVGRGATYCT
jgi:predicted ABC-type sugar transport system permease subunit